MVELNLKSIIHNMTLEEKVAQLIQLAGNFYYGLAGEITGPFEEMNISGFVVKNSGSVLGVSGAETVRKIQEEHLKNNRHGIPLLFMSDIVHGYKTIFPIPLAIGCSWDMELAEKSAAVAASEAAVAGVHVTFAPMVDLVRDPRWGRVLESTGEDSFLNSAFAKAFVRGFQGSNLAEDYSKVAACVKHFAAYGASEGGRDYNTVNMSERQMRESYLPAYKAALDEGCEMVMTSFNTVDGIPASGNKWLMREILREEWGFNGVLISDWGAVKELIPHGVADDEAEAARMAITAGVDIEMMTPCYISSLQSLIETGKVEEALLDEAVMRILKLKDKLGLFQNPYRAADAAKEQEVILSKSNREVARKLAEKSCVLIKNENVLPLDKQQKIALIGPFAQSSDILGAWSWKGEIEKTVNLHEALKTMTENLSVAQGCNVETITEEQVAEAIEAATAADILILAVGENASMSGEACSRGDITLPEAQLQLIKQMKTLNKPIAVILFNGRPLDLHGVLDEADAVLEAWYPGTEGAAAIANILYGKVNPSGKLAMSFPYSAGQIPVYYNAYNTGRPYDGVSRDHYVSKYLDIPNKPLLPFGFGLSYTNFTYTNLRLSSDKMSADKPVQVTLTITNTGDYSGEEIVQLYIRDLSGEVVRPVKELKDFQRVTLNSKETKDIQFQITEEQLRYYHSDMSFTSDAGLFELYVGSSSEDVLSGRFALITKES
ncbi:beta-glucosidase BglX [Niallia sp. BSM11]|uniref:beta-glucosidase BglX n=1 Tax=Niallia sp. BSM11 TaxID=3391576 RepID=UPI0039855EDE